MSVILTGNRPRPGYTEVGTWHPVTIHPQHGDPFILGWYGLKPVAPESPHVTLSDRTDDPARIP